MTYRAPVSETLFFLDHCTSFNAIAGKGAQAELSLDLVQSVLEEAGKFASERLAPLNRQADQIGSKLVDGKVVTPPGWKEAYRDWIAGGWNGLAGPVEFGGQGLPVMVASACFEYWSAAAMSFGLCPLLTFAGVDALEAHGSEELKKTYLSKMVSGEWPGTMQLTEPQSGSDLANLRTKAVKQPDGTYKISGTKIFITYGEHDMTDNIVHLVLARLPDAPAGTKGISLFLVPKFMVNADGSLGARNDVRCASVEHKLGIHASPTCVMVYGDQGGATGYLVGEENKGLHCMFTMMNNARLGVAVQGVAIAERATQQAVQYAHDRKQGKAPGAKDLSPIAEHPDVKRMLMTMRALTNASRTLCLRTASALDRANNTSDPAEKKVAYEEASLLTPVAKSFSTDAGIEAASLGVQVHGGMGFIEETGAAQHMRDARIAAIYEGTNGIQAIDLVTRKIGQSGGETLKRVMAEYRATANEVAKSNDPAFGKTAQRLNETLDALERATKYIEAALTRDQAEALAGATPYQKLFGLAAGGAYLAQAALAERIEGRPATRVAIARFFAENLCTQASGLEATITEGAASTLFTESMLVA
ncbi:MAG: acyl-CoA dehydrogenase [Xanthobacteraceae bacterium]|nr:acyl-CoA dehydrogenase [Xanthobacteraceae bacterium]MCW5678273.1 acyl-CoA dehydrogenase [Xanthobacteraceae bacterium]